VLASSPKGGRDEAQTLDTLVTGRASNDDHPRAVRGKLAGKRAAHAVRATDNGNLFAPAYPVARLLQPLYATFADS